VTVSTAVEAEIRRLFFAEHWPMGTVASQLGVHPDVVRRVLGLLEPRRSSLPRPRLIDPFVGFIEETLSQYPRLRATRLHDMLHARGFQGSVRTLREYVARVRPTPRREAFLRVEPLIGEQAQIDWAHVAKVPVPGGLRSLWLFVMVLSWSRAMWAEFVFDTTVHSLLRSLVRAAAYFQGATRQWLFDNPKIVVLERHGDAVRFHPLLLDLAGRFHVQLRLCTVRAANEKGRVERTVRFLRDRFLAGRSITGIEQGNRELATFLAEIGNARAHPIFRERGIVDCLAEERGRLLALPDPLPSTDLVGPASIDKTAFARLDTNLYSVPPAYAERTLTLVADDAWVRFLDGSTEVAHHPRSWGRRQVFEAREHREELLRQRAGAAEQKGQGRLRAAIPGIDALFARWVDAGRNVGSLTASTLRLLDLYGSDLLAQAVAEVLARGMHDPGALAHVCEQHRRAKCLPVPVAVELSAHVPDREVIPHDLESYDAQRRRD
jgi:transposase